MTTPLPTYFISHAVLHGDATTQCLHAVDVLRADGLRMIGGDLFGPRVNALRPGGVLSLVGAVAGGHVAFDAWQLIRPVTLTGYSSESLDGVALGEAIAKLSEWLTARAIRAPAYRTMPLPDAARAHELLEQGGSVGRVLLVPQPA